MKANAPGWRVVWLWGVLLAPACRDLQIADGKLQCSVSGNCPAPYVCATDGFCYRRLPADAATVITEDGAAAGSGGDVGGAAGAGGVTTSDSGAPPAMRQQGQSCTADADCLSTFCRDGVCCHDACDGACRACAARYTGGMDGVCANALAGTSPHGMCQDQTSTSPCGQDGTCDGSGQCHKVRAGQECGQASCNASMFTPAGACDGAGACTPGKAMDCGTFACAVTGCAKPCAAATDCPSTQYCSSSGLCKTLKSLGDGCAANTECGSGICSRDQVCCDAACAGTCQGCLRTQTGLANGTCGFIQMGLDPREECPTDSTTTCGRDGACDGKGACHLYASGTMCTATGTCSGSTFTPAKTCNGAGVCQATGTPMSCGQSACATDGCRGPCTRDADCASTSYCIITTSTCAGKKSNGAGCVAANECTSGACVDGVCCNNSCPGKCSACSAAKTGGTDGTCAPVKVGTDPDGECDPSDQTTCGQNGFCDGAGQCDKWPNGTPCGNGSCAGGTFSSPRTCSGGSCALPMQMACGAAACDPTAGCKTTCASNQDCIGTNYCNLTTHQCTPQKALGTACGAATECLSGFCVDGVCCNSLCNGLCVSCKAAQTGQLADGTCSPILNGTDPANECASDGLQCGRDGFCSGNGTCRFTPNTMTCGNATCMDAATLIQAPKCDGSGTCPPGTPMSCSTTQFCQTGACVAKKTVGATCGSASECSSGFCVDGVCCNTACGAACMSCLGAQTGGTNGTCANITAGTDPANECTASNPPCGLDGFCGGGRCRFGAAGVTCGSGMTGCNGAMLVDVQKCDGSGTCLPGALITCGVGTTCIGGACVQQVANGGVCQMSVQCQSNNCTGGVCCAAGRTGCGGVCVDLTRDNMNCGACATTCSTATQTCTASTCKLNDGQQCVTPTQCASGICNFFFIDQDDDHYGHAGQNGFCTVTTPPLHYASVSGDCCDSNPDVNPGVTAFHASAANCVVGTMVSPWDWNCSGAIEADLQNIVSCGAPSACPATIGPWPDTSCGDPNAFPQRCQLVDTGPGGLICQRVQNGPTEAQRLQQGLGGLGVLGCM